MEFFEVLLLGLALSMDAMAVSMAAGPNDCVRGITPGLRMSLSFGFFQFSMPVIGWVVGSGLEKLISSVDHWVAFVLLVIVGGRMIWTGFNISPHSPQADPTRGKTLIALSIATSIDALAVGMSLAFLGVSIWYPCLVIGAVTAGLSFAGYCFGCCIGDKSGKKMEMAGGFVLVLIGFKILADHLGT